VADEIAEQFQGLERIGGFTSASALVANQVPRNFGVATTKFRGKDSGRPRSKVPERGLLRVEE